MFFFLFVGLQVLIQFSQIGLMLSKSINQKLISKFKQEFESWTVFSVSFRSLLFSHCRLAIFLVFFCYRRSFIFSRELLDRFSN